MIEKVKEEKGITLVALVLTIIILLILAGVIVYLVLGQQGLTGKNNALIAEKDKAYAHDIVSMALTQVQKDTQSQLQPNTDQTTEVTSTSDVTSSVIDRTIQTIGKSSNFKKGADGKTIEYITNDGDKYVVNVDVSNYKVTDVN